MWRKKLSAWGHWATLLKHMPGSELLAAVEAVCQGRQFLSKGLSGHNWTSASDAQAPDHSLPTGSSPTARTEKGEDHSPPRGSVLF